jgi:hypothetical protein
MRSATQQGYFRRRSSKTWHNWDGSTEPWKDEVMHVFAVSKVHLDKDGRVIAVHWGRVNTDTNTWATAEVVAPVKDVVDAIRAGDQVFALFPSTHGYVPDRQFIVVDYDDGRQAIALDGPATYEREVHDMERLDPRDVGSLHLRSAGSRP